jgi:hypothetical protein
MVPFRAVARTLRARVMPSVVAPGVARTRPGSTLESSRHTVAIARVTQARKSPASRLRDQIPGPNATATAARAKAEPRRTVQTISAIRRAGIVVLVRTFGCGYASRELLACRLVWRPRVPPR